MPTPPLSDELAKEAADAFEAFGTKQAAAAFLRIPRATLQNRLKRAAERGLTGTRPVMEGFKIAKVSNGPNGDYIQQKPDLGEEYKPIDTLALKGRTTWAEIQPDGTRIATREVLMERADAAKQREALLAAMEGFKDEIPRASPVTAPAHTTDSLLSLYVLTDLHLGSLAWSEETGGDDYDLSIAERLVDDWFAAAIDLAPASGTAILAQLGDLLHWDGFESVTPTNRHVLDGDSRFDKMVRVAIRVVRKIIRRLLSKHQNVHIVMADANHDPASEAWMRGWIAAHYEDEPRVTVDDSAGTYYAYRHGNVSIFLHHGHRRNVNNVDSVFAGKYREIYGSTKYSYAHLGHLHSDELKSTNLMKVERHETLAAPDAYAANGGWLSGRSAKVITYSAEHGEVARLTLTPGMVAGSAKREAANDNNPIAGAVA